jgi:hypothetical protein
MGRFSAEGDALRVQAESTEAYWMKPTISNGATLLCDAGTVAGTGGVSGLCAQAASVINITANAAVAFPEVRNLKYIEKLLLHRLELSFFHSAAR